MTTKKYGKTKNAFSSGNKDTQLLSLTWTFFVSIRENKDFVLNAADFEKNEIWFLYYYNDIDDFYSKKYINFLNKFLKAAKFDKIKLA